MDSRLQIKWDGHVPGLANHRLSIGAFGEAIQLLLVAYRRIASNMLREAVGGRGVADKRLRKTAKWLDLQIAEVLSNSSGIAAVGVLAVPRGENQHLFEDLSMRAGVTLLEAIEAEATGHLRSKSVRNYLEALPPGISAQSYSFVSNGMHKEVTLGDLRLAETMGESPYLLELIGEIVSVGFEPGEVFIQIDSDQGKTRCMATVEQVEAALELRGKLVAALTVAGGRPTRLLNIRPAVPDVAPLSASKLEENLFGRWDELLQRLAK